MNELHKIFLRDEKFVKCVDGETKISMKKALKKFGRFKKIHLQKSAKMYNKLLKKWTKKNHDKTRKWKPSGGLLVEYPYP